MKREVWRIKKAGNLKKLKKITEDLPKRKANEVTVAVASVGLNFADVFAIQGLYSATPKGSFVPGLEFSGIVTACSAKSGFKKGDRVMGLTRFGAYASHVNVAPEYLQKMPAKWSFSQGAAYLVQSLTAWYALFDLACLKKNQLVLVHSAAGGVGLHALKMIQKTGAIAICTIGDSSKIEFLKSRGVDENHIIIRHKNDFEKKLHNKLNILERSGIDIVLDSVAGPYFKPAMKSLSPAGRYIIFGAGDFMNKSSRANYLRLVWQLLKRPRLDPVDMISQNHSLMAFNLIWLWDQHEIMAKLLKSMKSAGLLKQPPYVGHEYDFADAHAALDFFQSGKSVGKIVLNV